MSPSRVAAHQWRSPRRSAIEGGCIIGAKTRPVRIRPATTADFATILASNKAMADETEDKPLEPATAEAGVRNALGDSNRALYFIAEVDRVVAGQTMITPEWSDWRNGFFWWIQSVYVKPEYRRHGVFRALYEHIANLAKQRPDVCGLRLYVHRHNETAIETYRNLGMSQTDYLLFEEELR